MIDDFMVYEFPKQSGGTQILNTQGPSGDILGSLVTAAAGPVAGGLLSYGLNASLQDSQFEHQRALMDRAARKNAAAVQAQARLQAAGMHNAGLSAAQVNGSGAPSLQAGAAAGATAQLTSIFSGLSELVAAIKAPSEVEKNVAETSKAGAETNSLIPAQVTHFFAEAGKLNQETRGLNNVNDWLEAQNKFLKEHSPAIFESRIAALKASSQWDNLPPKTRETLEELALGKYGIEIGIGELEALDKVIATQRNMSVTDRELLENTRDIITAYKQITDSSVMSALAKLPVNQQNLMRAQVAEYYAMASQAKTQADLNRLNKWLGEHTSDQWLIEHGMSDEIERKKYSELFNQFLSFPSAVIHSVPFVAGGAAAAAGRSSAPPPVDSRGLYQYFK